MERYGGIGCFFFLFTALINSIVGTWSVMFLFEVFAHKSIDVIFALLLGLFFGEITIPAAIIVKIFTLIAG